MTDESSPQPGAGLPLTGVRVLALEQMQSMPFATQLLAHLGAEVIKVEHPVGGESGRSSAPQITDADGTSVGGTYLRNNLMKKSIAIDLKSDQGKNLVKRLVSRVDIVAENFKAGTLERLGLGYDTLAAIHPRVVYVSISGFGHRPGPYSTWPAYASVAEAMGGFYSFRPEAGRPPNIGVAGALGDNTAALFAAVGVLAALRSAEATGIGQHVDVAMFDAMIPMMESVPFNPSIGVPDNSVAAWPGIVTAVAASDGLFVLQVGREHQFERLADVVGRPEWKTDPRFATREGWSRDFEHVMRPALEQWASSLTKLEASRRLADAGVVAGPSFDADDIVNDPHVIDHNMVVSIDRPDADTPLQIAGNPIKLSGSAERVPERWPMLGEHTEAVLKADLGLSDAELADLRAADVIST